MRLYLGVGFFFFFLRSVVFFQTRLFFQHLEILFLFSENYYLSLSLFFFPLVSPLEL